MAPSDSLVSSTETGPAETSMMERMRSSRSTLPASRAMIRGFVVTPLTTPQAKMSLISRGSELSRKSMVVFRPGRAVRRIDQNGRRAKGLRWVVRSWWAWKVGGELGLRSWRDSKSVSSLF
jgi:hypothetical protein